MKDSEHSLNNLAIELTQKGRFKEASKIFDEICSTTQNPVILFNSGTLMLNEGKLSRAEKYLSRAMTLSPDHKKIMENLTVTYIREEKWDEAEKLSEKALILDETNPSFWNNSGVINFNTKNYSKAEKSFRQCIEILQKTETEKTLSGEELEILENSLINLYDTYEVLEETAKQNEIGKIIIERGFEI